MGRALLRLTEVQPGKQSSQGSEEVGMDPNLKPSDA